MIGEGGLFVETLPAGGGGGAPAPPIGAIQYNDPLGTFAGSADLTFDGADLGFAGVNWDLDPTGQFTLDMDADGQILITLGAQSVFVADAYRILTAGSTPLVRINEFAGSELIVIGAADANATRRIVLNVAAGTASLQIQRGSNGLDFLSIDSTTSEIFFGNSADNGEAVFLGSGDVRLQGGNAITILDRAADPPSLGGRGKLYVKSVLGVSELFFIRSNGTVVQIT